VLFRLAYLGFTNTLALLRLLPISDRDKDAEILALRHQVGPRLSESYVASGCWCVPSPCCAGTAT
jgi:hypothetical protein